MIKHSKMKYCISLLCLVFSLTAVAQPPNYYNSQQKQNAEYKSQSEATKRAYSVPNSAAPAPATPSSSSSSASSGSSSPTSSSNSPAVTNNTNGYSDIGAYDRVKRQEAAGLRNQERYNANMAALATASAKYEALIATRGNAKTDEDFFDLVLIGMRAGIDINAINRVIGVNLAAYKAKFGTHPDIPYKGSDGKVEMADHALLQLQKPLSTGNTAFFYGQVVKGYPTTVNFRLWADACYKDMDFENAVLAYKKVLADGDVSVEPKLAYALSLTGDNYSAKEIFTKITASSAGTAVPLAFAANQIEMDDITGARQNAIIAFQRNPEDTRALLVLAALTTDAAECAKLIAKAAALEPELGTGGLAAMLYKLARLLQKEGDFHESLLYLNLAVAADSKNIDYRELRYGTNVKLKRKKQAAIDEKAMQEL